jgi:hypothetical protein
MRGATKFEIALITSFTAVVAGVALWFFSDSAGSSQRAAAIVDAERLLSAATEWKKQHESTRGCPSYTQLRQDDTVPASASADDPWGGRYRIACGKSEVQVRSAGGDGRFKTDDDIAVSATWRS